MFCSDLAILECIHPHVPVIHSARDPFSASPWPLIYSTCGLKPGPQSGDHTLAHTKASGHVNLPPPGPQHPNDLMAKVIGEASPGRHLGKNSLQMVRCEISSNAKELPDLWCKTGIDKTTHQFYSVTTMSFKANHVPLF